MITGLISLKHYKMAGRQAGNSVWKTHIEEGRKKSVLKVELYGTKGSNWRVSQQ